MCEDVGCCLFLSTLETWSVNLSDTDVTVTDKAFLNISIYNQCIKPDKLSVQICLRSMSVKAHPDQQEYI